ncbi:furin-like protease 2, partial [Copidosoma floridanum]|uniref:furin-like protease 2 n=1 Tax=Copidosoma floridanum TaxID=29053 RepID=UPI0006C99534
SKNGTCEPCEANCQNCSEQPDQCTSCQHHLVLYKNKCYATCPLYTYETDDYHCVACHSSCETCNGSSKNKCIGCRSGFFFFEGECRQSCPLGYNADNKRRECVSCPSGCENCTPLTCTVCQSGWSLNDRGICTVSSSNQCKKFYFNDNNICKQCHLTCESCFSSSDDSCITCRSPLLLQSNRCVNQCDVGYYSDVRNSRPICVPCLHTCKTCVSRLNCTSCQDELQLQSGECRSACAYGFVSILNA